MKKFLAQGIRDREEVINICRGDIDYLKNELNVQKDISDTLNEKLSHTRNELDLARMETNSLTNKLNEGNKLLEMTVKIFFKLEY